MRIIWNFSGLALLAAASLLAAGCGGVSGSQSVSPASLLLPGLLQADPPRTNAPVGPGEQGFQLAAGH